MKIFWILLGIFLSLFSWTIPVTLAAETSKPTENTDALQNIHYNISDNSNDNSVLNSFVRNVGGYFYKSESTHDGDTLQNSFVQIAQGIKNIFILLAVCFLVFSVIKLFFSDASDDDAKKWKNSIVWTSIGIIFMQMAFPIWQTAMNIEGTQYGQNPLNAATAWVFWSNIISPVVLLLQFLASFAFFAVLIYAFYIIVTGSWDEKKLEQWKNSLIFGIVGFIMIQLPSRIVTGLYQGLPDCEKSEGLWGLANTGCNSTKNGDFSEVISLFGQVIIYFNRFLTVFCIIMAIYAGWLLFISRWDEENIKKAKNIIIYICIGLVLLVVSHSIFRFFLIDVGTPPVNPKAAS